MFLVKLLALIRASNILNEEEKLVFRSMIFDLTEEELLKLYEILVNEQVAIHKATVENIKKYGLPELKATLRKNKIFNLKLLEAIDNKYNSTKTWVK